MSCLSQKLGFGKVEIMSTLMRDASTLFKISAQIPTLAVPAGIRVRDGRKGHSPSKEFLTGS